MQLRFALAYCTFLYALYLPVLILLKLFTNKKSYYCVSFSITIIVILSFDDLRLQSLILMFILSLFEN